MSLLCCSLCIFKRATREKVGLFKDIGVNLCVELEDVGEVLNENFAPVFTKEGLGG